MSRGACLAGAAAGEHQGLALLTQAAESASPHSLGNGLSMKGSCWLDVSTGEIKEQPPAQLWSKDARSGALAACQRVGGQRHHPGLEETMV